MARRRYGDCARRSGARHSLYPVHDGRQLDGALAAQAVAIGRAALLGAGAAGEAGVRRAPEILTDELKLALKLSGVQSVDAIEPSILVAASRLKA